MAEVDYLILRNSVEQAAWNALTAQQKLDPANFQGKRFKVVEGGFDPGYLKRSSVQETLGGRLDYTAGPIFYQAVYMIRLTQATNPDIDATYGLYADLLAYFKLNNPSPVAGQPSALLHLVDHLGAEYDGYLLGELHPQPVTTVLAGAYAWWYFQILFAAKDAVA